FLFLLRAPCVPFPSLSLHAALPIFLAASLGLLGHAYPPGPERARATGLWDAMIGGGIAVGPFVSAVLAPVVGWRVVFGVLANDRDRKSTRLNSSHVSISYAVFFLNR